jgi:hypothetical protein
VNAVVTVTFANAVIVLDVVGKEDMMEVPILAAMDVTVIVTPVIVPVGNGIVLDFGVTILYEYYFATNPET